MDKYGKDIMLSDGDVFVSAGGDIFTTKDYEDKNQSDSKFEGYFNILISLTNRLLTVKGDNVFHDNYGSDIFNILSNPNSPNLKQNLQNAIRESLLDDDRVESVDSVIIEQRGNQASVKANITLVGSNRSSLFVFPNFVIE